MIPTLSSLMGLFTPSVRELPRFSALAEAVLKQASDLAACAEALPEAFSLQGAEGVQLDLLAAPPGLERPRGMTDEAFRNLLKAKLALWRWDGTCRGAVEILAETFPGTALTDHGDGSVTVSGTTAGKDLLPVPAGVRIRE
ncbi:MAG: hypothetical protein IJT94_00285 [Oscillibacter sp.]|nr:hypothetical protein [Oscillibacter sp.]